MNSKKHKLPRRILAMLLAICMFVTMFPSAMFAVDETGKVNKVTTSEDSGIQIEKSVEEDDNGNLSLVIDAWATGEKQVSETVKPVDIVLVLDQSGSMADGTGEVTYTYSEERDQNWSYNDVKNRDLYYYSAETRQYYPVYAERDGDRWDRTYTLYYGNFGEEQTQLGSVGDTEYETLYSGTLYRRTTSQITKLSALKDAVDSFVETVNANKPTDGQHRIAIVGFASGYYYNWNTYRYNNTELFVGSTQYRYNGGASYDGGAEDAAQRHYGEALQASDSSNLQDSIDALSANGGTLTNYGLEMANGILNTVNDPDREKVVIVFTDGQPGWSGYEDSTAEAAISQADSARANGATVYSVGIFGSEDETSEVTSFMENLAGDASRYLTADDPSGLTDIFKKIADEIGQPNVEADESSVLTDVLSEYFTVDNVDSGRNITVQTVPYNGKDKWGPEEDSDLKATEDGKNISVKGFDYSENYVWDTGSNHGGKKLRLTIPIKPDINCTTWGETEYYDTNASTEVTYGDSERVSLDDSPNALVNTYTVSYDWGDNAPDSEKLPDNDDAHYITGQTYDVDDTYYKGYTVNEKDEYGNPIVKYTFSGWDKTGSQTMGTEDVTINGSWTKEDVAVESHKVTYSWTGLPDGEVTFYNADGDEVTVSVPKEQTYAKGASYTVDTTYNSETVVYTHDQYGNVNASYTFSGWNQSGTQTMGTEDVTITGSWTKKDVAVESHKVTYSWTGLPDGEVTFYNADGDEVTVSVPKEQTYAKGASYTVDTTYNSETVVYTHDQYGNVNASYTFSGWDKSGTQTMGNSDVTITGSWTKKDAYTIESIEKIIIASKDDLGTTNPAIDLSGYTVPDGEGVVTIPEEGLGYVTLLYGITVKGTPGAPFTVSDDDATFVAANADDELSTGKDAVSGSQNEFFGTLPDDGEVTFYVSKPFEAKDIENGKISNTAFVVLEDDDNPKEATETTNATTEETPELPGNITALIGDKITVDCVNGDVEHADKVYGLIKDSFEVSKVYEENNKYYVDITLLEDHYNDYVEKYSEDMRKEHSLLNIGPDTKITLTWDGLKWVVPEQGLTVKVECVYGITDFDKFLVANNEQKKATGLTEEQLARFTFPDEKGRINLPKDGKVTLLYGITVTGDAGEEFTVTDENALLTPDITTTVENKDNGIFTGTIPESGRITFYVEKVFAVDDIDKDIVEGQESLVNKAEITEGDVVPDEKDDEEIVPVATGYSLTYEANGGYFANDPAKTTATVGELNPAEYPLWTKDTAVSTIPVDENGQELAKPTHAQAAPPKDTVISDADLVDVELIGWTTEVPEPAGQIYAAGDKYPTLTDKATIEDDNVIVYAVWGYDENNDGVADATQVLITPADITVYTGGTSYGGVLDAEGNMVASTENGGLPEPGYFITLPYDVQKWLDDKTSTTVGAEDLSQYMTFTYDGTDGSDGATTRKWGLVYQGVYETDENGNVLRHVYSLTPSKVGNTEEEIPVRLNYFDDTNGNGKLDDGERVLENDEIKMSADLAHDTFSMTINPGELDQSVIKATFNADGDTKDSTVGIGTGTLTVKSVTDVGTTTNAIGNSESDVTENTLTAVANDSVTYYVNDSQVDVVNNSDRVQLLVDSVSNNDGFNAQMGQHAIEAVEGSSDTHDYELAYMDLVDTANGNAEIKLGDNDKLTIYWPMPENADPDGDFQVVHYTDMNREGTVSDLNEVEKEKLAVTKVTVNGKDYLTFEVSSFSPFALVYTADDGSDTPDYPDYPIWTPDGDDDGPSGLNTEDHFSYVVGYAEDYRTGEATDNEDLWPVKPNNQITRAEVATIFYRLLEDEVRDEYDTTTNDFSDVTADSWYNQTVSTLARMGIVKGYEDGSFRPNAPITRAEFGAIATRFFAETGATYEPGTFTDVTGDEWYANAIQDAVNLGLIGGYPDGTVRPNNNITRAEACAIVNRTLGRVPDADHLLPEDVMKVWPDNNPTDWFYADMQEATNGHEYAWIEEDGHEIEEWTNLLDKDWTDR